MGAVRQTMWMIKWSAEEDKKMSLRVWTALRIKLLTKRDLELQLIHPSWWTV